MSDYLVRGMAAEGQIRFFAAYTPDTAEFARQAHNLSPVATAALGRLLTAGSMMGVMMKNEDDLLTLQIDCDGPIKGLTVSADYEGYVRGFVKNPDVDTPTKVPGHLNVADALDLGVLSVIRDTGLKDPYIGQTILTTSEIAEDLTYYFATSEQTPSSVALGVLVNPDGTVKTSGGFILQLMPFATEEVISKLEQSIANVTSVTQMLESGMSIEDIINQVLDGLDPEYTDKKDIGFRCVCSKERTTDIIMSLPKHEIQEMIDDGQPIEVNCQFCSKHYVFTVDELKEMIG